VAGALVVVVPVAAVLALFVHSHPDDHDTAHHAGRAVHGHFAGHTHDGGPAHTDGPVVGDDDRDVDRAIYIGAFLGEAAAFVPVAAVVREVIRLSAPEERRAQSPLQVVHGHDPPPLTSLAARAPPPAPVLIG
jgi:hypothetical protein